MANRRSFISMSIEDSRMTVKARAIERLDLTTSISGSATAAVRSWDWRVRLRTPAAVSIGRFTHQLESRGLILGRPLPLLFGPDLIASGRRRAVDGCPRTG